MKLKTIPVFREAVATGTSDEYENKKAETLTIQISGTFTTATVVVEGFIDTEYCGLAVINLKDYSLVENGEMTAKGQYATDISGMEKYRFKITALSGGNVNVVCVATATIGV